MNKTLEIAINSARKTGHSLFSPSAAGRWLVCTGSVFMEREYEDTSGDAAKLGSDKHELSEICLTKGTDPDNYLGRIMKYGNEVDEQFADEVRYYVEFVQRVAVDADAVFYEMRIDLSDIVGIPEQGGTADAVVLKGDRLYIIDAKFGYQIVSAIENKQELTYATGVWRELDALGLVDDVKVISLVIVQPQHDLIEDWQTTPALLFEFEEQLRAAVDEACGAFVTGKPVLTPGASQCKWCKAFADCPAAATAALSAVSGEELGFEDLDADTEEVVEKVRLGAKRAESYNARRLASCYASLDFVSDWIKVIAARTREKLEQGEAIPGFKLIAGRKGARFFIDPDEAEGVMKAARIKQDDMYSKKLISPTQAQKTLAKSKPRVWAKLEPLINQKDGAPVVVPESHPKPGLIVAKDQFDNLDEDEDLA